MKQRSVSRRAAAFSFAVAVGLAALPLVARSQDTPPKASPPRASSPRPDWFTPLSPKAPTPLFNGRDFRGLYTFLPSKGVNNDPEGVFTIEPGGVLRVSGKEFGYFATASPYADYHLTFEVKWGEKKWPPREKAVRDSGVLLHTIERDKVWPKSWECQIQENDFGDVFNLDVSSKVNGELKAGRIVRSKSYEKPNGEWNTVEVIMRGNSATNIVNGQVVNAVTDINTKRDGTGAPLTAGRIAFQSEGAEVFYRNITVKPLGNASGRLSARRPWVRIGQRKQAIMTVVPMPDNRPVDPTATTTTATTTTTDTGGVLTPAVTRPLVEVYKDAGDFELLLRRHSERNPNELMTAEMVDRFNELLRFARYFAPKSVVLKEDVDILEADTTVDTGYRAVKTTIVPTLHYILPEDDGELPRV